MTDQSAYPAPDDRTCGTCKHLDAVGDPCWHCDHSNNRWEPATPAPAPDYAAIEAEHFGDPDKRTGIYAPAPAPAPRCLECNDTGERDSGGSHPWGEPIYLACDCRDEEIGRRWRADSSLEAWFPITARKLRELQEENARLRAEPKITAPVAAEHEHADLIEDLDELASDLSYEGNQHMDQEAKSRATLIELGVRALRALTAPQAPQRPVLWVDPAELETLRRHGVGSIDAWASESGEATQGLYTLAPQRANQRTPEGRNVGNELLRLARKHEPLSHDFQAILQMAARGLGADGDAPELVELVPQQAELTDEQILDVVTKIDPGHQYLPRALQQLARAVIAADRALRTPGMADGHDQHAIAVELAATYAAERDLLARDAARYRLLRRGLLWSVIDGAGDVIWSDTLDGALDLVLAGQSHQKVTQGEKP